MRDTFEENKLVKVGAVWWLHRLVGWSDLGLVVRCVGWRPAGQVSCLLCHLRDLMLTALHHQALWQLQRSIILESSVCVRFEILGDFGSAEVTRS